MSRKAVGESIDYDEMLPIKSILTLRLVYSMYDKERLMVKIFASTTASLIIISRIQDVNPQNQSVKATIKRAIKISVARA